jgi:hypothetical protein
MANLVADSMPDFNLENIERLVQNGIQPYFTLQNLAGLPPLRMGEDLAIGHFLTSKRSAIKSYIIQLKLRWKTKAMTIWAAVGCP